MFFFCLVFARTKDAVTFQTLQQEVMDALDALGARAQAEDLVKRLQRNAAGIKRSSVSDFFTAAFPHVFCSTPLSTSFAHSHLPTWPLLSSRH